MLPDSVENPTESKFSPVCFWENKNFNRLAGEFSESKVNHLNNGVILMSEDLSECNDDSNWTKLFAWTFRRLRNNASTK
ncbi:hypothetical protein JTB14_007819 [Gonioctena quinquepunctata]|nr:hypothetical protein JTB14_007819 [Gonioctena quinquepunctata]